MIDHSITQINQKQERPHETKLKQIFRQVVKVHGPLLHGCNAMKLCVVLQFTIYTDSFCLVVAFCCVGFNFQSVYSVAVILPTTLCATLQQSCCQCQYKKETEMIDETHCPLLCCSVLKVASNAIVISCQRAVSFSDWSQHHRKPQPII